MPASSRTQPSVPQPPGGSAGRLDGHAGPVAVTFASEPSFPGWKMDRTFDKLVQEYQHRIFTYSSYHLGNQDEAQDVTQEVLLKLWNHWESLEPEIVWPWLVRVTRNASIDAIRKRNVQRRRIENDPEGDRITRVPSTEPLPDAQVETSDFSEHLQRALEQLTEPYRSIVILREVQQLKYEEISQALELPLNTIKVYLHRGRRKLRTVLQEYMDDETL